LIKGLNLQVARIQGYHHHNPIQFIIHIIVKGFGLTLPFFPVEVIE